MKRRGSGLAAVGCCLLACSGVELPRLDPPDRLVLLHTADLHSRLFPFTARINQFEASLGLGRAGALEELAGFGRLGSVLSTQLGASEPVLWLDSGDALEGAEVFERFGGTAELELLGALGLSAMALGNHELSLDGAALSQLFADSARFPVLAANAVPAPASPLRTRLAPSAVLDARGLKVGVVGVANDESPSQLRSESNPWQLSVAEMSASVQAALDELPPQVAVRVVLSHLGLDADRELVARTTGIDLVLGGHQHLVTSEPVWASDCSTGKVAAGRACSSRSVPIVHSGAYGKFVSRLELSLGTVPADPPRSGVLAVQLKQLPLSQDVPEEPRVLELLAAYRDSEPAAPLGFVPERLSRRSALGGDSALGNWATDAVRKLASVDVALLNTSGLRGDVEAGVLLRSELGLSFPFAEGFERLWTTGAVLKRGLVRAMQRSASRGCDSTLQLAGLRLLARCADCADGLASCVVAFRPGVGRGEVPLQDDELLTVAVPPYLMQPGADFEELGQVGGSSLLRSLPALLAQSLGARPRCPTKLRASCRSSLTALSDARCQVGFGSHACPVSRERAAALCESLPCIQAERDGRLELFR